MQPPILFHALADQTRLRILALVRAMELSVGEVTQVLGQSQPGISRHVKLLVQAGLVDRRKEGNWVFLTPGTTPAAQAVFALLDTLGVRAGADMQTDATRLDAVRSLRAAQAEDYFETHAAEWDAIRSLHVPEQAVEAAIRAALGGGPIGWLVDVGTGTGRMLALLGGQAARLTGFDKSPAMLRIARTKLAAGQGADLRQADMYALPLPGGVADVAVMHQVLHYAQHPAAAIAEAARILAPGGRLLVVDFAPHNREDLRDRDAHLRLGFSESHMAAWFAAAGLTCTPAARLEGALTVMLWLGHRI